MTTLHDFGSDLRQALGTSFGLSQSHGHGSLLVREVALSSRLGRYDSHLRTILHMNKY